MNNFTTTKSCATFRNVILKWLNLFDNQFIIIIIAIISSHVYFLFYQL